jgi:hypothetical protein
MRKKWVLAERHKLDYKEHRNQGSRGIKKKRLERNQDKWMKGRTELCWKEEVGTG